MYLNVQRIKDVTRSYQTRATRGAYIDRGLYRDYIPVKKHILPNKLPIFITYYLIRCHLAFFPRPRQVTRPASASSLSTFRTISRLTSGQAFHSS